MERCKSMENKKRMALIRELKAKYGSKEVNLKFIYKLKEQHDLNELEIEYIFFEDALLSRFVNA